MIGCTRGAKRPLPQTRDCAGDALMAATILSSPRALKSGRLRHARLRSTAPRARRQQEALDPRIEALRSRQVSYVFGVGALHGRNTPVNVFTNSSQRKRTTSPLQIRFCISWFPSLTQFAGRSLMLSQL